MVSLQSDVYVVVVALLVVSLSLNLRLRRYIVVRFYAHHAFLDFYDVLLCSLLLLFDAGEEVLNSFHLGGYVGLASKLLVTPLVGTHHLEREEAFSDIKIKIRLDVHVGPSACLQ